MTKFLHGVRRTFSLIHEESSVNPDETALMFEI